MLPHITQVSEVLDIVPGGVIAEAVPYHRPCAISLAHCGGLGAGFLLLTEVLGITPARPGFDGCILRPRIELLPKATGTFPSSRGPVSAGWEREDDRVRVFADLPAGMEGELRLASGTRALPAGRRTEVLVPAGSPRRAGTP